MKRSRTKKGRRRKKWRKIVNLILTLSFAAVALAAAAEIMRFAGLEAESKALRESVVRVPRDGTSLDPDDPFNRNIDFEILRGINPDICGWICIPGTKIDYPILTGDTDDKYLSADYRGETSQYGSVFTFAGADLENDGHICIFAHNLISGQMFGDLKQYSGQEYADSHDLMFLYTPGRTVKCRLLSVFPCRMDDRIFELDSGNDELELTDLSMELGRRNVSAKVPSETQGRIFTLSTCTGQTGGRERFTVHFISVNVKYTL